MIIQATGDLIGDGGDLFVESVTDGRASDGHLTWVGARDACAFENQNCSIDLAVRHLCRNIFKSHSMISRTLQR